MATAREEAERLVAAALAAAQFASRAARRNSGSNARSARDSGNDMFEDLAGLANMASKFLGASGFGGPAQQPQAPEKHHVIANGSDECCICPVCRAIAAIRDPSPEFAEKLATGASDLAAGLTSILRVFGEAARRTGRPTDADQRPPVEAETVAPAQRVAESIDEAAVGGVPVTEPEPQPEAQPESQPEAEPEDASPWPSWSDFGNVWRAATRVQDEPVSGPDAGEPAPAPAKKAVAKKTVAKKTVAKKTVAKKTVAKKAQPAAENVGSRPADAAKASAPAKKTAAKTAVKKAAPAKKAAAAKKAAPVKKAAAKKTTKKATPSASEPKKAQ